MDAKKFGAFVQSRRRALGMNQSHLAEQLHVTEKAVSRWERGVGFPDIKLLQPLADALEVTIVELMHGEMVQQDLSKEEASALLTQTVQQMQQQEQLSWKRRLLLYTGNLLLFAVYMFLYLLSRQYPLEPRWLSIPLVLIAIYGFQYGIRAWKAILTGTRFDSGAMKHKPMTLKMGAALVTFVLSTGLLLFTMVKLDDYKMLHDSLAVSCVMLMLFSGVVYMEQAEDS